MSTKDDTSLTLEDMWKENDEYEHQGGHQPKVLLLKMQEGKRRRAPRRTPTLHVPFEDMRKESDDMSTQEDNNLRRSLWKCEEGKRRIWAPRRSPTLRAPFEDTRKENDEYEHPEWHHLYTFLLKIRGKKTTNMSTQENTKFRRSLWKCEEGKKWIREHIK